MLRIKLQKTETIREQMLKLGNYEEYSLYNKKVYKERAKKFYYSVNENKLKVGKEIDELLRNYQDVNSALNLSLKHEFLINSRLNITGKYLSEHRLKNST